MAGERSPEVPLKGSHPPAHGDTLSLLLPGKQLPMRHYGQDQSPLQLPDLAHSGGLREPPFPTKTRNQNKSFLQAAFTWFVASAVRRASTSRANQGAVYRG